MYKKYKHHKVHHKNWVIFALVFISTSLVTSGLATFVVAQAKKNEEQGEVKVGVVNDTHVHFADLQFSYDPNKKDDELYKDKITFDADENENIEPHTTSILPGWRDSPVKLSVICVQKYKYVLKIAKKWPSFFDNHE